MSLMIGIKANSGLDGIVLAADCQSTDTDEGGNLTSKKRINKLYFGDFWAMGDSGIDDRDILNFYRTLRGDEGVGSSKRNAGNILRRAVANKKFPAVADLNNRFMQRGNKIDDSHSFFLAVNRPELGIWTVDEFGNFHDMPAGHDFDYACIGSGADEANAYIDNLLIGEQINRERIDIPTAMEIAHDTIKYVEKIVEGVGMGYDIVVVTKDSVSEHGRIVMADRDNAEKTSFQREVNKYR